MGGVVWRSQLTHPSHPRARSGLLDKDEFTAGYRKINPESTQESIDAKWKAVAGPEMNVSIAKLSSYWEGKLGAEDGAVMTDDEIMEVMLIRGLITEITDAEARKKRDEEEAAAVAQAEALLAAASMRSGGGRGRVSRRNSRELAASREMSRRGSKVIEVRKVTNVLEDVQDSAARVLQQADLGDHDALLEYVRAGGNANVADANSESVLHKVGPAASARPWASPDKRRRRRASAGVSQAAIVHERPQAAPRRPRGGGRGGGLPRPPRPQRVAPCRCPRQRGPRQLVRRGPLPTRERGQDPPLEALGCCRAFPLPPPLPQPARAAGSSSTARTSIG